MEWSRRALLVLVSFSVACSLGGLSGFSSGGAPSGDPDGGTPDATEPLDASDDVDVDASDGALTPQFFDDFERDTVVGPWVSRAVGGNGTISIDTTTFHSATRSLRAHAPVGTGAAAYLHTVFPEPTSRVIVTFWMKAPASTRNAQIARLRLETPDSVGGQLMLEARNGTVVLAEQAYERSDFSNYARYDLAGFKPDVWQQWTLEVDASASPTRARVTIDGALAVERLLSNPFPRGALHVHVGIAFVNVARPELTVHYDDVAVTYDP